MYFFTDDIPYFVDDSFMRTHLRVDNPRPWFPLPPLSCGACARSRCWRSHYFSSSSPLLFGFWSSNCKYLEFFSAPLLACLRNRTLHHQNGYHWTRPIVRRRRGRPRASKPIGALLNPQEWIWSFFKCGFAFSFCGFVKFGSLDPNLKSTTTGRNQTPLWRLWVWMQEFVASKEFLVYLIDAGAEMLLPFDTKVCSWGWPKKLLERVQVAWSWRIEYWFRV